MLQYLDTHRDRQVMKVLIVELTNVRFASTLQSRRGTTKAIKSLESRLGYYEEIHTTSQMVRNDLNYCYSTTSPNRKNYFTEKVEGNQDMYRWRSKSVHKLYQWHQNDRDMSFFCYILTA